MTRFMLDTDTVSFALRGSNGVVPRLLERKPSEVCMSAITFAELRFGADKRRSRKLHRLIEVFARSVRVVPFDEEAASRFGALAAELARLGKPIGSFDTLIAAHALTLDLDLVTNNTKHFSQVPGLRLQNWAD